jgi:outer membrane protein assembly factor BamB
LSDGSLAYTLDNPNPVGTSTEDYFGMAVDLDDDFVIVGAPYEDDAGTNYAGKAYIFDLTDGSLVNTIDDPNAFGTTDNDRFGHAVAISDGRLLISASREDDGSGTSANSSGKAYIFKLG